MRKIKLFLFCFLAPLFLYSQQKVLPKYEIEVNNMPSFYKDAKKNLSYPLAWQNSSIRSYKKWRKIARSQVFKCLMNMPPQAESRETMILAKEKRVGFTSYKIEFNISDWSRVSAYLLVPEGEGPFPAIVLFHDHGGYFAIGKEKVVRPFAEHTKVINASNKWVDKCYDSIFLGDYFANKGYAVLAVDAIFWGERGQKDEIDYDGQQAFASNLMQLGSSFCSVITADDLSSVDFLSRLDCVDPEKIGVLGFSMGAHRAWMASALSDRINASASICWMNTTDYLMTLSNNQNKGGSAFSMLIPGLRRFLDYPDVASIACPKPALFFNGNADKLFPADGVNRAYSIMKEVWKSQKAEERLITKIWNEHHFFNKEMLQETYFFFHQWLGN